MSPTIKCYPVWEEVLHVGVCASALLYGEVEHLLLVKVETCQTRMLAPLTGEPQQNTLQDCGLCTDPSPFEFPTVGCALSV